MSDDTGGVLLQHYRDQLAAERERKQSLERRGQAVVATNGAIVTLLFAFGTVDIDTTTFVGVVVRVLFVAAMAALIVSAGLGLFANRPEFYAETDARILVEVAESADNWAGRLATREAQRQVARDIAKVVKAAKPKNNRKGKVLRWAVNGQVLGLVLLAATLLVSIFLVDQEQETRVPDASEQSTQQETQAVVGQSDAGDPPLFGEPEAVIGTNPGRPLFGDPVEELRGLNLDGIERTA